MKETDAYLDEIDAEDPSLNRNNAKHEKQTRKFQSISVTNNSNYYLREQ